MEQIEFTFVDLELMKQFELFVKDTDGSQVSPVQV